MTTDSLVDIIKREIGLLDEGVVRPEYTIGWIQYYINHYEQNKVKNA